MLDPFLRSLRDSHLANVRLPALTFFEPTDAFFAALAPFKSQAIVECGAGMGHVTKAAQAQGFNMRAIDLVRRKGQWKKVEIADAELQPYSPELWPLMCRPDHSGWVYDVLERALTRGAQALYVGLDRNLEQDLGEYVGRERLRVPDVGEEGEMLLVFDPSALLPPDYFD